MDAVCATESSQRGKGAALLTSDLNYNARDGKALERLEGLAQGVQARGHQLTSRIRSISAAEGNPLR